MPMMTGIFKPTSKKVPSDLTGSEILKEWQKDALQEPLFFLSLVITRECVCCIFHLMKVTNACNEMG